jgi:hypothetical protein
MMATVSFGEFLPVTTKRATVGFNGVHPLRLKAAMQKPMRRKFGSLLLGKNQS